MTTVIHKNEWKAEKQDPYKQMDKDLNFIAVFLCVDYHNRVQRYDCL
jgi:hypothetical protein